MTKKQRLSFYETLIPNLSYHGFRSILQDRLKPLTYDRFFYYNQYGIYKNLR